MIEIEAGSPAMRAIQSAFNGAFADAPRTLRIWEDGDGIKVKVNEGMWTAPLRTTREPAFRVRCSMIGHVDHWADECRYGERDACVNCGLDVECEDGNGDVWHDRGGETICPSGARVGNKHTVAPR